MKLKCFILTVISVLIILSSMAIPIMAGNTYYIAKNGDNSNNGSINSPWASLQHAIEVAGAGDTILMREGEYETNEVWIRGNYGMGGANGLYLTIRSYPGETASVGGSRRIIIEAPYVRIEGLHIRMPYRIQGSDDYIQLVNNTFKGSQPSYGAIEFRGNNGLIEGNRIEITDGGNTQDHCIYLHHGKNNVVRSNYLSGASGYGLHIYDERKSGDAADYIRRYENIIIEQNVITKINSRAGIIISAGESNSKGVEMDGMTVRNNIVMNNADGIAIRYYGQVRNVNIFNNVVYQNDDDGISISANNVDNVAIKNNILCNNKGDQVVISSDISNLSVSHNLYYQPASYGNGVNDNHPLYSDPLFVNVETGDFTLKANSPAIDAGTDVGIQYKGSAPDLGAFEYGLTSTSDENNGNIPNGIDLQQNYPNPFNSSTQISYKLPYEGDVRLKIFDMAGHYIVTLIDGRQSAGDKSVQWDGKDAHQKDVSSGAYFYKLQLNEFSVTKKMLFIQ